MLELILVLEKCLYLKDFFMQKHNKQIFLVCLTASLAGLLFGLDIAFVNGSLQYIAQEFHISQVNSQQVAGYLLFGAALGAILSAPISNIYGRKKVLVLAGLIFTICTLTGMLSNTLMMLLISRFFIGISVGIASFITPLYLSEMAPYKLRGGLGALYQLMITLGIVLMFISNYELNFTHSWRIMMSILILPSVLMLVGCLRLPESPRWLILNNREKEARKILNTIRCDQQEVDFEVNEINSSLKNHKNSFGLLKEPFFLKIILLGVLLQVLQQFTGMNAFMYYSGEIFRSAGFDNPALTTVIVGIVNVLTTVIAVLFVDKFGRKPILYFGLTLLAISCLVVGYLFSLSVLNDLNKFTLLIFCLLFIFAFAISLGPVVWIVCSEIYPLEARDLGLTFSTATNWICNFIIGSYTLTWFNNFGKSNTFWAFGLVSVLGLILVNKFTPETKGVTLEHLEINLKNNKKLRDLGM